MPKIACSAEIHAALDTIWKILIEKVEQPQTYVPGVTHSRILQHYGNGVLREVKGDGVLIKEKVVIDKPHGEVHYFLLEHPLFSGKIVNRVVPSSVQNPAGPQIVTIEVDWTPKDEQAEQLLQNRIPERVEHEVLTLKQRAEAMEKEVSLPVSTPYAFGSTVALPFAEVTRRLHEELHREGFSIISEIDIKQRFREKLHKEFRNYLILGVCNPGLAYQAFGLDINLGTVLPCNVVLYSLSEGRTVVMVMDPVAALSHVDSEQIAELSRTIKDSMQKVLNSL